MLKLENISKSFSLRGEKKIAVLSNLNLELNAGQSLLIYGSNGSGKTTLLNIIKGEIQEDNGKILFNNKQINNIPSFKRSKFIFDIKQKSGENLCDTLTLFESYILVNQKSNSFFFKNLKSLKNEITNILSHFELGFDKLINNQIKSLSGGEYQIFNMALLHANIKQLESPCLVLLDEHLAHLDPVSACKVYEITKEICSNELVTSIIISHNLNSNLSVADRTVILKNGTLQEINKDSSIIETVRNELSNGQINIL